MSNDIKQGIRGFVLREVTGGQEVSDDESLLDTGLLDSMAMTKLTAFIGDHYGVAIPEVYLEDPEKFESILVIADLVTSLKGP